MKKSSGEKIQNLHENNLDVDARSIYLFGKIDESSALSFLKNLHILNKTDGEIHVYINTDGGNNGDGMLIYDAISMSNNNIHGHAMGECSSMGSVILQACHKRSATQNTVIMVHPGNLNLEGTLVDVVNAAKYYKEELDRVFDIYYNRVKDTKGSDLKISKRRFKKYFMHDRYITAKESLKLGLIDIIEEQK